MATVMRDATLERCEANDLLLTPLQAYMEDHLRNKNRLMKEWEALCSYQAEPSAVSVAQSDANAKKNRCADSVPCE